MKPKLGPRLFVQLTRSGHLLTRSSAPLFVSFLENLPYKVLLMMVPRTTMPILVLSFGNRRLLGRQEELVAELAAVAGEDAELAAVVEEDAELVRSRG